MFKGLGNLANIGSLLKQAQQMGGKLQQIKEDLKVRRAEGTAGGGMVTVEVNGLGDVLRCRVDPSLVPEGDRELLEDLLPAAINQALTKSRELHAQAMQSMTEGLDVSGMNAMLEQWTVPTLNIPRIDDELNGYGMTGGESMPQGAPRGPLHLSIERSTHPC